MESKSVQIQRIIYQLVDLADDPESYNDERATELVFECLHLKHRGHITALKRLQSHYESETEQFLCYLLLKRAYLIQNRFDELADLPYQEPPNHLFYINSLIDIVPWFIVSKPFLRKCSGLIRMSQHEDHVIRRFAINLLSFAVGQKGLSYLFQHLCIAQTLEDINLTLNMLMDKSVPGGAERTISFLHRIAYLCSESVFDTIDFKNETIDTPMKCKIEFYNFVMATRKHAGNLSLRALIILSTQPRFTPAVTVAKKYLKDPKYTGPALICLLQHSPLKDLRSNFNLFKQFLAKGKLTIVFPEHDYDPVVEGFRFFKRYARLREETRNLYFAYITSKSMALPTEQFENLLDLADDFAI